METLRATVIAIGNFFSGIWNFIVRMYENFKDLFGVSDVKGAVVLVLVALIIVAAWINREKGFFKNLFAMFALLIIGVLLWSIHPLFLIVIAIWWTWKYAKMDKIKNKKEN